MQRRDFVKFAPAAAIAASVPATVLANPTSDEGDPVILWNHGEELLPDFPEALVSVYKDGFLVGSIKMLDSRRRRIAHVPEPGQGIVETTYDAVTVRAPLDVLQSMRDANVLPRHWVGIAEPCLRITARERILLEKSGRSIEKIVVSLPVSKHDTTTTPFGSGFDENSLIWYVNREGQLQHEEGYPDDKDEIPPDELMETLENSPSVNGWIELQWTDGVGHLFLTLEEGERIEWRLTPTRRARVVDLTKRV